MTIKWVELEDFRVKLVLNTLESSSNLFLYRFNGLEEDGGMGDGTDGSKVDGEDGEKDCGEAGKVVFRADGEIEGVYDGDDCGQDSDGYG